jgi:hypothetical protein
MSRRKAENELDLFKSLSGKPESNRDSRDMCEYVCFGRSSTFQSNETRMHRRNMRREKVFLAEADEDFSRASNDEGP